jgi:hypothetical protein
VPADVPIDVVIVRSPSLLTISRTLQLRLRRLALESPVPGSLLICQELDRHTPIIEGQCGRARTIPLS